MENGDETLASPTAAAEEEQVPVTHAAKSYAGAVAEEEEGAKSYAAVADRAEIEHLRTAKLDLEEKLAEACRQNKTIVEETHRLEGVFMKAREEVTLAEDAAITAEKEAAELRAEIERLQAALKIEKGEHELDKSRHEQLAKQMEAVHQEKLKLEEEIKALKALAATTNEREAAPSAEAPKEAEVPWQGMAVAAAAGAAITSAVVLICLRLKR